MKTTNLIFSTLAILMLTVGNAFAVSTTRVYNSGILVLLFLGVCALVVVAQLIPAIMTLWGMLKGIPKKTAEDSLAQARTRE